MSNALRDSNGTILLLEIPAVIFSPLNFVSPINSVVLAEKQTSTV